MISAKPTEHLTGITIQGDHEDFYELVDCIYRMTGLGEDYRDPFWGVKNRLLGLCYDIRHAYMGDRNVLKVDNGMDSDKMKWHSITTAEENVYYSVEVMFPEAMFVALSVPSMFLYSRKYYGESGTRLYPEFPRLPMTTYHKDCGMLQMLSGIIWEALTEVIGMEESDKLMHMNENKCGYGFSDHYMNYVTHYVDKCNIEYLKCTTEKRKDKIRNITKRLIQKPAAYIGMQNSLMAGAKEYKCSIYELEIPGTEDYPEVIEW